MNRGRMGGKQSDYFKGFGLPRVIMGENGLGRSPFNTA